MGRVSAQPVELPELYDAARIVRELRVSRATAERLIRACPHVQRVPGSRKVLVRAEELQAVLDAHLEAK
jgi:hypothetical protein